MTDIGFGLIDRRTVIMVLFTMVIAQLLFGLQIPVDAANVGNLFIDLVLLTGYLYLSRSVFRLPIALLMSLALVGVQINDLIGEIKETREQSKSDKSYTIIRGLKMLLRWSFALIY